jgi:hypothetical protein
VDDDWDEPYYPDYDDGGDVQYRDDAVYVEGERYASSDEYYEQAKAIASAAPKMDEAQADKIEWLPLGVFACTTKSASNTNIYLQLAVSKEGIIGGTFFNDITNTSRPLEGTVDKKTQRAAWMYADGKNTDTIMETSIYNLTKDKTPVLVHFGPGKTEIAQLVRVPEEPVKETGKSTFSAPKPPRTAEQVAEAWYGMVKNYVTAGKQKEAKEYLGKMEEKYPESKWAKKAKKLISEADFGD